MRSWGNLVGAANRIDAELRNDHGSSELTDIATKEVLVTIAVSEIRRRGA